jgi:hypothetical protein
MFFSRIKNIKSLTSKNSGTLIVIIPFFKQRGVNQLLMTMQKQRAEKTILLNTGIDMRIS